MASILAGLLCRFIGARFIASFDNIFICCVSKSYNCSSLQIKIVFKEAKIFEVNLQCCNLESAFLFKKKHYPTPQKTTDEELTCAVAHLIVPFISKFVICPDTYPGTNSLCSISDRELVYCIGAFSGSRVTQDDLKRFKINNIIVNFWPRYISFKGTKEKFPIVQLPPGIMCSYATDDTLIFTSQKDYPNVIDAFIVNICRAFIGIS